MTMDFFLGQLRLALVAFLAYAGGKGWLTPTDSGLAMALITSLGPIIGPWIWSVYVNINGKVVPHDSVAIAPESLTGGAVVGGTVMAKQPLVKVVGAILIAFLILVPDGAHAQGVKLVKPTGNIVQDIAAATGQNANGTPKLTGNPVIDLTAALDAKLLPDLQYALKLATASNSVVTAPCFQAWIDIINTRIKAVQDDQTPPQAIPLPDIHLITDFEKLVEIRNALQPESPFMIKCSPVASMVKLDIAKFMGVVISGGAGLAMLVPGL